MKGLSVATPPRSEWFPIGSIYINVNTTNPGTIFGGTWEQIKDTFLLCSGSTYSNGSSGGQASVTLSTANMPAHTHTRGTMEITGKFRAYSEYNLNNTAYQNYVGGAFSSQESYGTSSNLSSGSSDCVRQHNFKASDAWTGETSSVGSGSSFSNMPPYLAVTVWKRIA